MSAATRTAGPGAFARITKQFEDFCHFNNLESLASAANRHGSIVWEAGRHEDLNRFIMMGMTDAAGVPIPRTLKRPPRNLRHDGPVEFAFIPQADGASTFEASNVDDAQYLLSNYLVELSVAADDGRRFTRRIVETWYYTPRDNITAVTESGWLGQRLQAAWDQALRLTEKDLEETFVIERLPK
jgi:hypothetical protein